MLSQQSVIYIEIFFSHPNCARLEWSSRVYCWCWEPREHTLINCSSVTSCFPFQDVLFIVFFPSSWINHFVNLSSCQKVTRVQQGSYRSNKKNPQISYPQFWFFSIRVGNMELNSIKIWQENVSWLNMWKILGVCADSLARNDSV